MSTVSIDQTPVSKFHTKWFDEKCRDKWNTNLLPALNMPIDYYLEIGVGEGHSMRWVLEHLKPGKAIGIDPYKPKKPKDRRIYLRHMGNMHANLGKWLEDNTLEMIYASSYDVLTTQRLSLEYGIKQFDLIYVDGNHQCFPCALDCMLCWHLLKQDGIMIMDDYNRRWQRGWPQSHEGINAFLGAAKQQYDLVWGDSLGLDTTHIAIRKVRDDWIHAGIT